MTITYWSTRISSTWRTGDRAPHQGSSPRVTEQIKLDLIGVWHLIADAYKGRIWIPFRIFELGRILGTDSAVLGFCLPRETPGTGCVTC